MSVSDVFLLVVRWLHLVSAAAWVGGSIFYLVVLRPALRRSPEPPQWATATSSEFRALVDSCIFVLLVTGVILTVNRLTPNVVGVSYVSTLGIKIALSVWMFVLARGRRRRTALLNVDPHPEASTGGSWLGRTSRAVSGYNAIVILGIIVFLLSDLLKVLFELALRGA